MKTFKQEARQFASSVLAGVMLFGTMFGSSTAFADEALPEVENSPVIIVDPSEQPYQAYGSRLVSADSLFPGLVVLSADTFLVGEAEDADDKLMGSEGGVKGE